MSTDVLSRRCDAAATLEMRSQADRLSTHMTTGRFRRKPALEDSPGTDELVARAVRRAREGDSEAVRYLYVRYSDNVYGYVRSIVHDDHEAEDVTQHVFAKLITAVQKYEERTVPFSHWMLRMAHNAAIDHLRRLRPMPCEEVRGADEHDPEAESERILSLRVALETLPEDQRKVLVLRHLVGLSPGEIASRMGRSKSSVHGLHHRGRGALRAQLRALEAGPTIRQAS